MNYFTDSPQKRLELQQREPVTPSVRLSNHSISDLFAQASSCGYLTQVERYQLMLALLAARLSEEEQAAIDRLLYAVCRGRIRLLEEATEDLTQPPLNQAPQQLREDYQEPALIVIQRSVEPLSPSRYVDLPRYWHSIEVLTLPTAAH